jgi:hypothetical protein
VLRRECSTTPRFPSTCGNRICPQVWGLIVHSCGDRWRLWMGVVPAQAGGSPWRRLSPILAVCCVAPTRHSGSCPASRCPRLGLLDRVTGAADTLVGLHTGGDMQDLLQFTENHFAVIIVFALVMFLIGRTRS